MSRLSIVTIPMIREEEVIVSTVVARLKRPTLSRRVMVVIDGTEEFGVVSHDSVRHNSEILRKSKLHYCSFYPGSRVWMGVLASPRGEVG